MIHVFDIRRLFSHPFAESFPELTSNLSLTAKKVTVNQYVTYRRMVWELGDLLHILAQQLAVVQCYMLHCVAFCHHWTQNSWLMANKNDFDRSWWHLAPGYQICISSPLSPSGCLQAKLKNFHQNVPEISHSRELRGQTDGQLEKMQGLRPRLW